MQRKIRILFTIPNFLTAGSGREMMNIIERLDKKHFEPFICVETAGGQLFEEARDKGYTVIVHSFTVHNCIGKFDIVKRAYTLAKYFKPYSFDLWQSFNWSSDFSEALVSRLSGAKYIYVKKSMNWNRVAWKVKSFLAKGIVARNTTMFRRFFKAPYLQRKTYYIPGGVDNTRFYKCADSIRDRYNITADAVVVCCVAQLVRSKDQATLIKAIAGVENVFLIVAGTARDATYSTELHELVRQLGIDNRVVFAGNVNNVNGLLNSANMFVLPTTDIDGHEEGCPVSLLEAMAAEVPCIASNVAGNRDLIQTNKTGLLFSPNNDEELKSCILKYIANSAFAREMALNALKLQRLEYTLDTEAEAFNAMYKKIAGIKET